MPPAPPIPDNILSSIFKFDLLNNSFISGNLRLSNLDVSIFFVISSGLLKIPGTALKNDPKSNSPDSNLFE